MAEWRKNPLDPCWAARSRGCRVKARSTSPSCRWGRRCWCWAPLIGSAPASPVRVFAVARQQQSLQVVTEAAALGQAGEQHVELLGVGLQRAGCGRTRAAAGHQTGRLLAVAQPWTGPPKPTPSSTNYRYQGETWVLDSPDGVCAGQAWFEYPATFVLFSKRPVPVPSGANGVVETVGIEPTDLPVAGRMLCQLSYVPVVEPVGLEPTLSCLPGRCPSVRPGPQAGPESRNRTSPASGGGFTDRLASQRPRDSGPRQRRTATSGASTRCTAT
jgi:hypothetical protein